MWVTPSGGSSSWCGEEAEAETTGQVAGVGVEVVVRRGAGDMPEGKAARSKWGGAQQSPAPTGWAWMRVMGGAVAQEKGRGVQSFPQMLGGDRAPPGSPPALGGKAHSLTKCGHGHCVL